MCPEDDLTVNCFGQRALSLRTNTLPKGSAIRSSCIPARSAKYPSPPMFFGQPGIRAVIAFYIWSRFPFLLNSMNPHEPSANSMLMSRPPVYKVAGCSDCIYYSHSTFWHFKRILINATLWTAPGKLQDGFCFAFLPSQTKEMDNAETIEHCVQPSAFPTGRACSDKTTPSGWDSCNAHNHPASVSAWPSLFAD